MKIERTNKLVSIKYNLDLLKQSHIDGDITENIIEENDKSSEPQSDALVISNDDDDDDLYLQLELDFEEDQNNESDNHDEESARWTESEMKMCSKREWKICNQLEEANNCNITQQVPPAVSDLHRREGEQFFLY